MTLEQTKQLLGEYSSNLTYEAECPALIPTSGKVCWEVTHGLSTSNVVVGLFNKEGVEVEKDFTLISPNRIEISWSVEGEVLEGDYTVLVISGGASSGIIIDKDFSEISTNPVQNATLTEVIHKLNVLLHELNSGSGVD